jgi:DNA topoisomerase-1
VKRVALKENFTKQPARYNPRSLLMKMEKEEIGTKATRAGVIQTLFDRKYIEGTDTLAVSGLGRQVTEILSKYCPEIVSSQFTRTLEDQMNQIQIGNQTKQEVLHKAVEILKPVATALKANEADISQQLNQSIEQASAEGRTVGTCSKCVGGKLVILRSKKTGKRFVGCTNYFKSKCNASFPLPQNGLIKPLKIPCKKCGSPMVNVLAKGKHTWKLCLNPECPTKRKKIKEQKTV